MYNGDMPNISPLSKFENMPRITEENVKDLERQFSTGQFGTGDRRAVDADAMGFALRDTAQKYAVNMGATLAYEQYMARGGTMMMDRFGEEILPRVRRRLVLAYGALRHQAYGHPSILPYLSEVPNDHFNNTYHRLTEITPMVEVEAAIRSEDPLYGAIADGRFEGVNRRPEHWEEGYDAMVGAFAMYALMTECGVDNPFMGH